MLIAFSDSWILTRIAAVKGFSVPFANNTFVERSRIYSGAPLAKRKFFFAAPVPVVVV